MRPEHWLFTIPLRLRSLFRRAQADQELDNELRDHLEQRTDEYVAQGLTQDEAHRRARLDLEGVEQTKEKCRDARRLNWIQDVIQDLRYGLRVLRKSPGFTAIAVLTIALGIGANTAIFSMVDWLILRPLPVRAPRQLTYLIVQWNDGGYENAFSYPTLQDILKETKSTFSYVTGVGDIQMDGLNVNATPVWTSYVTGDFFEMLGIRPTLGRFILRKAAAADPVLVISYSFWRTRFGGDSKIIGKEVSVNGHPVTIIGVAPEGFHGVLPILDTQGYLPLGMAVTNQVNERDSLVNRQEVPLLLVARLNPGVSLAETRPLLDVAAKRIAQQYPQIDTWKSWKSMRAVALGGALPSSNGSNPLGMVAGIFLVLAGLVLLLACLNIANLLLVRAAARRREMAVRSALGAARIRLLRQMLTESLLLAAFGCSGGVAVGFFADRAMGAINLGVAFPILLDFQLGWRVLL